MSKKSGLEARRDKRFEVSNQKLNATLAIVEENKTTGCLVPIKDFSKSGAGVYIKFEVGAESKIRLALEGLPYDALDGRVVWCRSSSGDPQAPPTHPFRLGIEFTPPSEIERDNQDAVYKHLSEMISQTLS